MVGWVQVVSVIGWCFICILRGNRSQEKEFIRSYRKSSPCKPSPYKDFLSDRAVPVALEIYELISCYVSPGTSALGEVYLLGSAWGKAREQSNSWHTQDEKM